MTDAPDGLQSRFQRADRHLFCGFAFDPMNPDRHFTVEVLIDNLPLRLVRADQPAPDLSLSHGFSVLLRDHELADASYVEARLANLDIAVGTPITLADKARHPSGDPLGNGDVRWLGGLRFRGTIGTNRPARTHVDVLVEGLTVARARPSGWTHTFVGSRDPRPLRAFDVHLPEHYADGRMRRVSFLDETGRELRGSPITFIAFADGLRSWLAKHDDAPEEDARAALFDRLFPASLPLRDYPQWRSRFPLPPPLAVPHRVAVLPAGDGLSFDADELRQVIGTDPAGPGIVVLCPEGARLEPGSADRMAGVLEAHPETKLVYGDLDILQPNGGVTPLFFPAFDYERHLEQGYAARLFAARRDDVLAALDDGADTPFALFLAILGTDRPAEAVAHLPVPVAAIPSHALLAGTDTLLRASAQHLTDSGVRAEIEPMSGTSVLPAIRIRRHRPAGDVTLLLAGRNSSARLERALAAIMPAAEARAAPILIVDNSSTDPATHALLGNLPPLATVLNAPGSFSLARLFDLGLRTAKTPLVCLLDDGIEAASEGWLDELASRIGHGCTAAAPVIADAGGAILQAGLILGPAFSIASPFIDSRAGQNGPGDVLRVAHQRSAAGAACLMLDRAGALAAGGFDAQVFPRDLFSVDLALRMRERGERLIVTPHAVMTSDHIPAPGSAEIERLRERWGQALMSDPYHHPALALGDLATTALAWPPRDRGARWPSGSVQPPQP
ncbi:glycosyltransferase family 2 protein [Terrihabitans sp. B22-R8]|uniref:glycosyltransferase family 2 protein n=1 Tax=Terrihabitans sp. B22-R8 TaxID=3425128 RepID=UPI00403C7ABB